MVDVSLLTQFIFQSLELFEEFGKFVNIGFEFEFFAVRPRRIAGNDQVVRNLSSDRSPRRDRHS
jgi:hypothetical protein